MSIENQQNNDIESNLSGLIDLDDDEDEEDLQNIQQEQQNQNLSQPQQQILQEENIEQKSTFQEVSASIQLSDEHHVQQNHLKILSNVENNIEPKQQIEMNISQKNEDNIIQQQQQQQINIQDHQQQQIEIDNLQVEVLDSNIDKNREQQMVFNNNQQYQQYLAENVMNTINNNSNPTEQQLQTNYINKNTQQQQQQEENYQFSNDPYSTNQQYIPMQVMEGIAVDQQNLDEQNKIQGASVVDPIQQKIQKEIRTFKQNSLRYRKLNIFWMYILIFFLFFEIIVILLVEFGGQEQSENIKESEKLKEERTPGRTDILTVCSVLRILEYILWITGSYFAKAAIDQDKNQYIFYNLYFIAGSLMPQIIGYSLRTYIYSQDKELFLLFLVLLFQAYLGYYKVKRLIGPARLLTKIIENMRELGVQNIGLEGRGAYGQFGAVQLTFSQRQQMPNQEQQQQQQQQTNQQGIPQGQPVQI